MKIGLTLSGGGARGFVHLGVLHAIDELGIKISALSGASAGAIVGAFYAANYKPKDILEIVVNANLFRILRPAISLKGLLSLENSYEFYQKHIPATFEELSIPLYVAATDIQHGRTVFFSKGELIKPIQASTCLPAIFAPVEIHGQIYIDGGILDNLPVEPLIGQCDTLIGVHCNPLNTEKPVTNVKVLLEKMFLLLVGQNVQERIKHCDLYIEPPLMKNYAIYDISKAKEMFEIGYEYSKPLLKEKLIQHN